jgi:hypothetical protein
MVVRVPVKDRNEARLIQAALNDSTVRAFVLVAGALIPLEPRAQHRVLAYVSDAMRDPSYHVRRDEATDAAS